MKHKCKTKKMEEKGYIKFMGCKYGMWLNQFQYEYVCKCGKHWYKCQDMESEESAWDVGEARWYELPDRLWTVKT